MQETAAPRVEALRLERLGKTFGGRGEHCVVAVEEVSLAVPVGQFLVVVGESGSGKSTLMHCAAGLSTPSSGRVVLGGVDLNQLPAAERQRVRSHSIGFVFQDYNLVSSLTVAQNVALPRRIQGDPLPGVELDEVLRTVGLTGRADHLPHQLSGGEQQRVAIARVLATRPAIVFADEPTSALDLGTSRVILDHLERLTRAGTTVVMVTHDIDAATRAERAVVMAHGRAVADLAHPSREELIDLVSRGVGHAVAPVTGQDLA